MKHKKIFKISLAIIIVLIAGIFYSCRDKDNQEAVLSLQNQDSKAPISSRSSQSDYEVTGSENKVQAKDIEESNPKSSVKAEDLESDNALTVTDTNEMYQSDITNMNKDWDNQDGNEELTETIYVHLCGAVKNPNVYQVDADSRLIDIINLAGGLLEDAAGDFVNQASKVSDGQQIYIPTKDEVVGKIPITPVIESMDGNQSDRNQKTDKVNINTATKEELMTLSGIGESKADSIIAYREEHNGFKEIEEIKKINGIKDSVYNKVCDKITIN